MAISERLEDLSSAVLIMAERIADDNTVKLSPAVRSELIAAFEDGLLSGNFRMELLEAFSESLADLDEDANNKILFLPSDRLPEVGQVIENGFKLLSDDQLSCLAVKPAMFEEIAEELMSRHYKPGEWFKEARKRQTS